ncbi:DNA-directed RNA polymerase [Catenaria anguillulae PL171]|uniref:DNA-directed RNA polymerase n=1 Tax=Catenaria anguillulae PL171 TaxID=765915 RepID=A0A1Y2HIL3_9FUNG|nr:DNA-directed RNA polymerase [Catenaria anguillulae PL171]
MTDQYQYQIPPGANREEFIRDNVFVERDRVTNGACTKFPGAWANFDDSWDLDQWKQQYRLVIHNLSKSSIEFDMIGVHASVANTIRRILLSDIPTVAFDQVYIFNNTGVMVDEVLSHRLGLIPIQFDPSLLQDRAPGEAPTDLNTLVFKLNVKCTARPDVPASAPKQQRLVHHHVTAADLEWSPEATQAEFLQGAAAPVIPHKDIVITKLNEGEEVNLVLHAIRGKGSDHAKFSPVGTATYRLMPEIHMLRPVVGDEAVKFQQCFPKGVIELEYDQKTGKHVAKVADARKDTVSREVLRHKEFEDAVTLSRKRDHFIFRVESVGILEPQVLMVEAFKVLRAKAADLKKCLDALNVE